MNSLFNKRYHIRLVWLIIICLALTFCAVFFAFRYIVEWDAAKSLDNTTKVTLAILAFLTLIYHIHNLENQIKTQEASNRQNLSKYTYDICSDFRKPIMMEINDEVRLLFVEHKDKLERQNLHLLITHINDSKNKECRQALFITLNYFESISAMVLAGDLDNEIVKRLYGRLFGKYYKKLEHYINYVQEESPRSWINFEKLAIKWINEDKH
ncbi:DUF4760 domain-containing protein [Chryseobacterium sp. JK1]|uniref:DUF4760 domain-containing protein n=1 Tax=Chryseobacterium sp. JK1 TaxID=874294 RepID=UPI003D69DE81